MSSLTKTNTCPKAASISCLGVEVRGVVVDEGGEPVSYLFRDSIVESVTRTAGTSPFSDYLRDRLKAMVRPVRVDMGGRVEYVECLSEDATLDILMQLPNEIGARVRSALIKAYRQLLDFYRRPLEAVGHFAEAATDLGHDEAQITRKVRYHVRRKSACNANKDVLEEAGKYGVDKKLCGWTFAYITAAPVKAATGQLPSEIKVATGSATGFDGSSPTEQDLAILAQSIMADALRINKSALATRVAAGSAACKQAYQRLGDHYMKPIEDTRDQLKAIGLLRRA